MRMGCVDTAPKQKTTNNLNMKIKNNLCDRACVDAECSAVAIIKLKYMRYYYHKHLLGSSIHRVLAMPHSFIVWHFVLLHTQFMGHFIILCAKQHTPKATLAL